MSAKVPHRDYLEAMEEGLSDALGSDDYSPDELAAISSVRSALLLLIDPPSEQRGFEAALEAAADSAFSMIAKGD